MLRHEPAPPRIPDYELLREIGRGSYGTVWIARSVTGLFRAVKIVWRASFPDPAPYEREFRGLREFAAVSLAEPRLLALLHVGRNDSAGFFYYVMELADDVATGSTVDPERYVPETLREVRSRRGRLPAAETLALGVDLANALAGLHDHGLVHRDIKPSNIIFVARMPKLADVGLVTSAASLDDSRSRVGNLGYMPPDCPGSPAADVYGLGKVLYELVTGRGHADYPRLPPDLDRFPDRPELLELNEILLRACADDKSRRYPDARSLLEELRLLQAGKSVRRLRAAERHLARALRIAAGLALSTALAGSGAWIQHRRASAAEAQRDALARRTVYAADLAQAQRAIDQADYGRARRLLDQQLPASGRADLRGPEWHALARIAQGDPCQVLRAAGPAVDRAVISPDRTLLAVHDASRQATIYAVAANRELRRIDGIHRLAGFSRDGQWLFGTDANYALRRWRVSDGAAAGQPLADGVLRPLGMTGDDQVVAFRDAATADRKSWHPPAVVVVDLASARVTQRLALGADDDAPPWEFFRAQVSARGTEVVIACVSGSSNTSRFRLTHVTLAATPIVRHERLEGFLPTGLAELPGEHNSEWWASEASSGRQLRYDRQAGKWMTAPRAPLGIVAQARIQPHGPLIQAHNAALTVTLPDGGHRLRGHAALITDLVLLDAEECFTTSATGEVRRWQYRAAAPAYPTVQCWNSHGTTTAALFSAGGDGIIAPLDGTRLAVLSAASLSLETVIPGLRRPIAVAGDTVLGISATGKTLAAWSRAEQRAAGEWLPGESPIVQAGVSGDGNVLCVTRLDGSLASLDRRSPGDTREVAGAHHRIWPLVLNRDGSRVWSVDNSPQLQCRLVRTGEVVWAVPMATTASSVTALSDAAVAVALRNGDVQVHHGDTGERLRTIASGSSSAEFVLPTPDRTRLFIAGIEGDVGIVDVESGLHLATLRTELSDRPYHMALSPNGTLLSLLSQSGTLRVLKLR